MSKTEKMKNRIIEICELEKIKPDLIAVPPSSLKDPPSLNDVSNYMKRLKSENDNLIKERNSLKNKVFELEAKSRRGWFYKLFFS